MNQPNRIKEFIDRKPKDRRNSENHPWKKAFSKRQAKDDRERRKEMQRLNIK